jgi:hypothetical protein
MLLSAELFLNETRDIIGGPRFETGPLASEGKGEPSEKSFYAFRVARLRCACSGHATWRTLAWRSSAQEPGT